MILVTLLALLAIAPAEAKKKKNTEGNALIAFVTESHDFGIISDDKGVVSTEFEFTNQGNAPLVITSAKADCGCTRPEPKSYSFSSQTISPRATAGTSSARSMDNKTVLLILFIFSRFCWD